MKNKVITYLPGGGGARAPIPPPLDPPMELKNFKLNETVSTTLLT